MPWLKCPHGCFVEVPSHFFNSVLTHWTCPQCHRVAAFDNFKRVDSSSSVKVVDKATTSTQSHEHQVVIARIGDLIGGNRGWFVGVEQYATEVYHNLVRLLMNAEVTSNFPTPKLLGILETRKMLNMWHLAKENAPLDKYATERDAVEKLAFASLDGSASERSGSARPVYTVLSVGNFLCGGAPNYGNSYVIYKDSVKMRCTYTASDTIQMWKQSASLSSSDVCNFGALPRILMRVTDRYLKFLASYAAALAEPKVFEFIEAQAWGELDLTTDVQAIVLSEVDLENMPTEKSDSSEIIPPAWVALDPEQRKLEVQALKEQVETFCGHYGIKLYYLPLHAGTTGNTTSQRPHDLVDHARRSNPRFATIHPRDRVRIGLDRLERLVVGCPVWVVDPDSRNRIAAGTVTWEANTSMSIRFDDLLEPEHSFFANGWWRNGLRFDKGSNYIELR
jgi:hypothetical protein